MARFLRAGVALHHHEALSSLNTCENLRWTDCALQSQWAVYRLALVATNIGGNAPLLFHLKMDILQIFMAGGRWPSLSSCWITA
jgi:hypothetical protein